VRIRDKLRDGTRTFSFEFFPPKTPEGERKLLATVDRLRELGPSFVTMTYGAGGSTRRNTIDFVARFQDDFGLTGAAHLTCVGHSRDQLVEILEEIRSRGIENVMLLRGDPPRGERRFVRAPDGFANAYELIRLARSVADFSIGAAAYPEGHQECADKRRDLEHLKLKVDSGADFVVTQLFFDNADYFRFVDQARDIGIGCRIIPGIMPVTNWPQIQRMAAMCGAAIPPRLADALIAAGEEPEAGERAGTEYAIAQCEELIERGAPGIHFYTLNQSRAVEHIFAHLRKRFADVLARAS
jgi:methylenetetrahydrofolate reductase (NADPH)